MDARMKGRKKEWNKLTNRQTKYLYTQNERKKEMKNARKKKSKNERMNLRTNERKKEINEVRKEEIKKHTESKSKPIK